jgi:transcriptional regulator with XRE-family HTH domain
VADDLHAVLAEIGANIRRQRERLGWTQAELAEVAEIELSYLQKVEYGTARPSLAVLLRIATAMGTSFFVLCRSSRAPNPRRQRGRPRKRKLE